MPQSTPLTVYIRQIGVERFHTYRPDTDTYYEDEQTQGNTSCLDSFDEAIRNPASPSNSMNCHSKPSLTFDDFDDWLEIEVMQENSSWGVDLPDGSKGKCWDGATPSVALRERLSLYDSPINPYDPPS